MGSGAFLSGYCVVRLLPHYHRRWLSLLTTWSESFGGAKVGTPRPSDAGLSVSPPFCERCQWVTRAILSWQGEESYGGDVGGILVFDISQCRFTSCDGF